MSTHVPGFQSFSVFLHPFVLVIYATSSIRVKGDLVTMATAPQYEIYPLLHIRHSVHSEHFNN